MRWAGGGGRARRINHSCVPNLTTIEFKAGGDPEPGNEADRVFKSISRIGFFAQTNIKANEELYLDYSPGRKADQLRKVVPCRCGTAKCKQWLF